MTPSMKQSDPPLGVAMYIGADPAMHGRIGAFHESIAGQDRLGYSRVELWFACDDRHYRVNDADLMKLEEQWGTFVRESPADLAGKRVWFAAVPAGSTDEKHPPGSVIIFRDTVDVIARGEDVLALRAEKTGKTPAARSKQRARQSQWKSR